VTRLRQIVVSVLGALAVAALALGVGMVLGPVGPAGAAPTPEFTLTFDGLAPNSPMTEVATFTLDRDATLTSFEWLERAGLLAVASTIEIEVCDSTGACVDPTALGAGVPFAAGTATVSMTVELLEPVAAGTTGAAAGRLIFTAEDDENGLPLTGLGAAPWIAAGASAIVVGALLMVLLGRRRRA
jgi:hypothetical protein